MALSPSHGRQAELGSQWHQDPQGDPAASMDPPLFLPTWGSLWGRCWLNAGPQCLPSDEVSQ